MKANQFFFGVVLVISFFSCKKQQAGKEKDLDPSELSTNTNSSSISEASYARQNILETGDFEGQETTNPLRTTNQIIGPFTIERCADLRAGTTCPPPEEVVGFVNDPAGGTNRVARFVVKKHYERAEVRAQQNGYTSPKTATGTTMWYGWRLFIPSDSDVSGYGGLVSQFHAGHEAADRGMKGSPTTLRVDQNNWSFYIKYQTGTSGSNFLYTDQSLILGSNAADRGKWTEWVVQAKWTHANTGFIRIWKNGTQVVGGAATLQWENRATYFDISESPTFKMGCYKGDPDWTGPSSITIFGDDYRLGNAQATYADVAPNVTTIAAPTGLTATAGNTQASLSWTASAGATSYTVKRATVSNGTYTTVASGLTGTSYTNTGLTNLSTYYYVVTASNTGGQSSNSNQASARPFLTSINESFTTSPASNFTVSGGTWGVSSGLYNITTASTAVTTHLNTRSVHNTTVTGNFELTTTATVTQTSSTWNDFAVIFGFQDTNNYYYAQWNESNDPGTHGIFKVTAGATSQLVNFPDGHTPGVAYSIKVERRGSTINAYRNGILSGTATDGTWVNGKVGLGSKGDTGNFDNFKVIE